MSLEQAIKQFSHRSVLYTLASLLFTSIAHGQIGAPPVISAQPVSTAILIGGNATFSVVLLNPSGVTYQWYHNGVRIPSGQKSSLAIKAITSSDAGNYTVTVVNASGSVTSLPALLTVLVPPVPLVFVGSSMTPTGFNMQLSGSTGYSYVISASRDLSNWTPISTNAAPLGVVDFTDTSVTNRTRRFYKAQVVQ